VNEPTPLDIAKADYADIQRRAIHDGAPIAQILLDWIGQPVALRAVGELGGEATTQTLVLPRMEGDAVAVADIAIEEGKLVFGRDFTIPADAPTLTVRSFLLVGGKRALRMRLPAPVTVGDGEADVWAAGSLIF
jgi:hypothetical protein